MYNQPYYPPVVTPAYPYAPPALSYPVPVPVPFPQLVQNTYDPYDTSDYNDSSYSSADRSSPSSGSTNQTTNQNKNLPVLRIRKHPSKSSLDPQYQDIPSNLRATDNQSFGMAPLNVTIRRRTPEIEQQPVVYPYPVFVAPPPVQRVQFVHPTVPQLQPDYRRVQPVETIVKPLSPPKIPKEKKKTQTPPAPLNDHFETETFSLPSTREREELKRLRPPVRVDSQASILDTNRSRSRPIIVDEYEKPKMSPPGLSYRPLVTGKTTREMENENADLNGAPVPNSIAAGKSVTYRDRQRRR